MVERGRVDDRQEDGKAKLVEPPQALETIV
jgi:hypothetical protein